MQAIKLITRRSIREFIQGNSVISQSSCHKAKTSLLGQINTLSGDRKMSSSSTPVYTVEYLTDKLKKALDTEHLDIQDLSNCGCGMKFDAVIVSPKFEAIPSLLQRQRLVNQTLAEEMKHIHAFTMKTLTPAQWEKATGKKEQGGEI